MLEAVVVDCRGPVPVIYTWDEAVAAGIWDGNGQGDDEDLFASQLDRGHHFISEVTNGDSTYWMIGGPDDFGEDEKILRVEFVKF